MGILRHLEQATAKSSGGIALQQGDSCWTFPELLRDVDGMARRLAALGAGERAPVAVLCENRPEILIAYYAVAQLGGVFIPINPVLSEAEVCHVIQHSETALLIHDVEFASTAARAMPNERCRWTFERLRTYEPAPGQPLGRRAGNTGDFLVIYTSGSTGAPKAAVFNQAAETGGNASLIEMWGIGPQDVTLVALPLGFLYGLSTAAATGLQAGGKVVVLRKFHPRDVLNALTEHSVTIFHGVPTMFAMILNYAESEGLRPDLSGVRLLISAGAPLAEELRARFEQRFGKRIDDYYALTEVRPVFGRRFDDPRTPPKGAIGKAAPNVNVSIAGDRGQVLPAGEHGELIVRAPGMFLRYAKAEELTEKALCPLGFRTGDVGFVDSRGYYYLTGRIKDIIIRGGANISPAEVENVLASHPAVDLAGVVGCADTTFGEVVAAFVTVRAGAKVTPQELIDHCSRALAAFKVPAQVRILKRMPLGSTGKIDKNALRALARNAPP